MLFSVHSLLLVFFLFILFCTSYISTQPTADADTDFSCSSDSPVSCETYLTFRARPPDYLSVGSISDLFGVSRLSIAKSNHLSSEDELLKANQLLLVPIDCNCNGSRYFSNVTYQIKKDDSFYLVSITAFENLTNFLLVQDMNPTLVPNKLNIGDEVVFPLLCRCPNKALRDKGIKYLITYVWQPADDILSVSSMFNASPADILVENNYRNFTAALCLPVLIPVSELPVLVQAYPFPAGTRRARQRHILSAIVGTIVAFLICMFFSLVFYIHRSCRKKMMLERNLSNSEFADIIKMKKTSMDEKFELKIIPDKLLPGVSGYLDKPIIYDEKVITEATKNFSERYRIGGSVYKAMINGQVFAVKKFHDVTEELKILQRVNHANLVKLIGISTDNDGKCFLVYEYAENDSLDKWLFPKSPPSSCSVALLTWTRRLSIALDVANGLQYMHEHSRPSIVHGDIRTTNILLNSKFKAKICNFATARSATSSLLLKADVFAFGVFLFELLSGRKGMEISKKGEIVWKEIRGVLETGKNVEERLASWMDSSLKSFYPIGGALILANLAAVCTSEKSSARPSMTEIVFNLSFLTQSTSEMEERSWTEPDESLRSISPVVGR
ncbi:serine/threonine receptor-like kinase NFP [Heracleum sosnowskyi]|uniref:Serine/threonine receptor-like kinase NFP n=1 Tax=Heracleum sosnowskyi TaxID=360622 RepID=A0AAD8ML35_9APIA|nr:serine/threonine receptor-like kinase NFP [Heracleum sosnowskyi]